MWWSKIRGKNENIVVCDARFISGLSLILTRACDTMQILDQLVDCVANCIIAPPKILNVTGSSPGPTDCAPRMSKVVV